MKFDVNIDGKCRKCVWGCNSNKKPDFTLEFGLIIQKTASKTQVHPLATKI